MDAGAAPEPAWGCPQHELPKPLSCHTLDSDDLPVLGSMPLQALHALQTGLQAPPICLPQLQGEP